MMNIKGQLVAISLAIAGAACFLPFFFPSGEWDSLIRVSRWLTFAWLLTFVWCVVRYRKKGLWFSVGFPLLLYWPYVLFMIGWGCAHNIKNCP